MAADNVGKEVSDELEQKSKKVVASTATGATLHYRGYQKQDRAHIVKRTGIGMKEEIPSSSTAKVKKKKKPRQNPRGYTISSMADLRRDIAVSQINQYVRTRRGAGVIVGRRKDRRLRQAGKRDARVAVGRAALEDRDLHRVKKARTKAVALTKNKTIRVPTISANLGFAPGVALHGGTNMLRRGSAMLSGAEYALLSEALSTGNPFADAAIGVTGKIMIDAADGSRRQLVDAITGARQRHSKAVIHGKAIAKNKQAIKADKQLGKALAKYNRTYSKLTVESSKAGMRSMADDTGSRRVQRLQNQLKKRDIKVVKKAKKKQTALKGFEDAERKAYGRGKAPIFSLQNLGDHASGAISGVMQYILHLLWGVAIFFITHILIAIFLLFLMTSLMGSVASVFKGLGGSGLNENESIVYFYLTAQGMDPLHISAIMGNWKYESQMDPEEENQDNYGGIGIAQWNNLYNGIEMEGPETPRGQFEQYCAKNDLEWDDISAQLEYFWWEYETNHNRPGFREEFESTMTLYEATAIFCHGWQHPDDASVQTAMQMENAYKYYELIVAGGRNDELAGLADEDRLKYLYGDNVPTDESAMLEYMTTIKVPIYDLDQEFGGATITCNSDLAGQIYSLMYDTQNTGYRIDPSAVSSFNWDAGGNASNGTMITLNAGTNVNSKGTVNEVIEIWENEGFHCRKRDDGGLEISYLPFD